MKRFNIDSEIAALPLRETNFVNSPNRNASTEVYVSSNLTVNIPAGTGLDTLLEVLMTSNEDWVSRYMIEDSSQTFNNEDRQQAIKVWELDTYTDINLYDELAGKYSYIVTYYIRKFTVLRKTKNKESYERDYNNRSYQIDRLNYNLNFLKMKKRYDYIYTGTNTEILDLTFNLNYIWYQSSSLFTKGNYLGPIDLGPEATVDSTVDNIRIAQNNYRQWQSKSRRLIDEGRNDVYAEEVLKSGGQLRNQLRDSVIEERETFGDVTDEDQRRNEAAEQSRLREQELRNRLPTNNNRIYAETVLQQRGVSNDSSIARQDSVRENDTPINVSVIFDGDRQDADYQRIIENTHKEYRSVASAILNNAYGLSSADLIRIDLNVKGDPHWLGISPYERKNNPNNLETISENSGFTNYVGRDNIFLLTWRFANQIDNDLGLNESRNSDLISSIYIVTKVTSTFSDGMFTQNLEAYRDYHTNLVLIKDRL